MARKITVKFNGKVIGTRKTDRTYTHALVLTDYNPSAARDREAANWRRFGADNAKSGHAYAVVAQSKDYRYASVTSDTERARYAEAAALSVDQYVAGRRVQSLNRLEEHINKCISKGAAVLSYHGSRELAFKAQAAASKTHPEYLVLVEPVEE